MKTRIALLLALSALPASGADVRVYKYDVDTISYICPVLCTPATRDCYSNGVGTSNGFLVTTSGASSTTVTGVTASEAAFANVTVGDVLTFSLVSGPVLRQVTAVASSISITVDSALTIPSAGVRFRHFDLTPGTGASTDGWTTWSAGGDGRVCVSIEQLSATGGLDYKIESRQCAWDYCTAPLVLQTDNLTGATAAESIACYNATGVLADQIRVCLKIGTADDDVVTITAGVNDKIDFVEGVNITITAGFNDKIDFVEDPGGVPDTCAAIIAPGSYSATALAAIIQARMNTSASCSGAGPSNTYGVTWSSATRKFTVARTAGVLAFDLPWLTGANAATSCAASVGYTADDTGALSYLADNTTYASAELTATLTAGIYTTGALACAEVEAEMQAVAVSAIDCAYSSTTDKITISATGISELQILWNSGTNNATSADTALGFAADSTGALTYTGIALGLDASNEIEKITVTVQ